VSRRLQVAVAAAVAIASAVTGVAAADGASRAKGDVQVFAKVPAPGFPALTLVTPHRDVYVGTFTGASGSTTGPSKVFRYSDTGKLLHTYRIKGQEDGAVHAIQVAERDRRGRLYLLDQSPARVLVLNPRTGRQRAYATFADVPSCSTVSAPADCSNTAGDNPPEPDYAAWLPGGSLVVTDYAQQLLWQVPPGGGKAHVWMNDLPLNGEQFGPAGIVMRPSHRSLLMTLSATAPGTGGADPTSTRGKLFRIGVDSSGHAGALRQLWVSGTGEAPDGFALSRRGHVYVALSGPSGNAVAEVVKDSLGHWQEVWRTPGSAAEGESQPVPWDTPTSAQFLGRRLLVTNQAFFTEDSSHWAVLDVMTHERAAPHFVPRHAGRPPR
jgi:sugar lactone lactonase YvrE